MAYEYKRQVRQFMKRKHRNSPLRRAVYRAMRIAKWKGLLAIDPLEIRQANAAHMWSLVQFNMVGVVSRYRDCDHVVSETWQLMRPVPRAVERYMDEARYNAEGPGGSYVMSPRDLATKLKTKGKR